VGQGPAVPKHIFSSLIPEPWVRDCDIGQFSREINAEQASLCNVEPIQVIKGPILDVALMERNDTAVLQNGTNTSGPSPTSEFEPCHVIFAQAFKKKQVRDHLRVQIGMTEEPDNKNDPVQKAPFNVLPAVKAMNLAWQSHNGITSRRPDHLSIDVRHREERIFGLGATQHFRSAPRDPGQRLKRILLRISDQDSPINFPTVQQRDDYLTREAPAGSRGPDLGIRGIRRGGVQERPYRILRECLRRSILPLSIPWKIHLHSPADR